MAKLSMVRALPSSSQESRKGGMQERIRHLGRSGWHGTLSRAAPPRWGVSRRQYAEVRPKSQARRGTMEQRRLGSQGLQVSAIGLGCMGMSEYYGEADEAESVTTI